MNPAEAFVFIAGAAVAVATLGSAVRTVVLPRAIPSRIARRVFLMMRRIFRLRLRRATSYEDRDRIMAYYGPAALLTLLSSWLVIQIIAFVPMYWALGVKSLEEAFAISGSSLTTLGFARHPDLPATSLAVLQAVIGLTLLALLITYLPSIYTAFSRREQQVATLEVFAGYPPDPAVMLLRLHRIRGMDTMDDFWQAWERWFIDIEETHASFPALSFFRSQQPYNSWVTAAGVVLDCASISLSSLDRPDDADAQLMIRSGYVALRRIAAFSRIPFDPDPRPDDPISIERSEFDGVFDRLEREGIPMKADRDQAWRDFAGWRVNYDTVLVELAALVMAPPAGWSTDRLTKANRPTGPGDHMIATRRGTRRMR